MPSSACSRGSRPGARAPDRDPAAAITVDRVYRSAEHGVAAHSSGRTTVSLQTPATSLTSGSEVGNGEQWHRIQ